MRAIHTVENTKRSGRTNVWRDLKRNRAMLMMSLPAVTLTLLFAYIPMFGMLIAFKKVNMRDGIFFSPWCGLENFHMLFSSNDVWVVTRNTLAYNLFFILIGTVLSVGLAIILDSVRNRMAKKVYQTVLIMPYFLSMVIVSYLVLAFLNMENGYLNHTILPFLGYDTVKNPINWYTVAKPWPIILTIVNVWKTCGYNSIVYLAAIAGIDTNLYEAAEIDGAGTWHQIRYITLPSLKTIIIIQTILSLGKIFGGDFGLFFNVTQNQGALYSTTYVLPVYIYNMLTGAGAASLGYSSAASFLQSVLGFILVVATNAAVKKIEPDSALF